VRKGAHVAVHAQYEGDSVDKVGFDSAAFQRIGGDDVQALKEEDDANGEE